MHRRLDAILIAFFLVSTATGAAQAQGLGHLNPDSLLREADANHDGVVTRGEFLAARMSQFDMLDRRRQGYLSLDALPHLASTRINGADRLRDLLRLADANRDGKITRWEFDHAPAPVFEAADTNHDGLLDKTELARVRASLRR